MLPSPRWRKLWRDLRVERGRMLLMFVAVAVSLTAVGTVLGAFAVLRREIAASYRSTRPASVTLELAGGGGIDGALLDAVRRHPAVAEAEARDAIVARSKVGEEWRRTLLFVVDDFADLRLNRFWPAGGAWPPPEGTALAERSSLPMLDVATGGRVLVKPPHGPLTELAVSGLVHDPGLAPAWQERSGYLYVTRRTLALLGEPSAAHELRVALRGEPVDPEAIRAQGSEVAAWLAARGHPVHQLRIPPPAQHPHQRQMSTLLLMMLAFAAMALVLSAILAANSLAAMLARQVREIGVMKAVGATAGQIAGLYAALVSALGLAAVAAGGPAGLAGARALAARISAMLNVELADATIPPWVTGVVALAGIAVPLAVAALPIRRASRVTVRQAIDDHGVDAGRAVAPLAALPVALRDPLRRPARLALTVGLLAAAGATFMTARNMELGWRANVAKVYETRAYDMEAILQEPRADGIAARLRALPGVTAVEAWGYAPAVFSRPGELDVVRTYPDRSHGSLWALAPPPATRLLRPKLMAGRWLEEGDRDAVVLNHSAAAQVPGVVVGSVLRVSLDGAPVSCRVAGVVEEIGAPATVYVPRGRFAAATGTGASARLFRLATGARTPGERAEVVRRVEAVLLEAGAPVESVVPLTELRTAVGDHVLILVRMLVALAVVLGVVGAAGLASAMGIAVVERTREIGVMRALGATPRRINRMLVAEAGAIGAVSGIAALVLSLPLTLAVDRLVGMLGFLAPLPLVVSAGGVCGWLALLVVVSALATLLPARRATAMAVREALAAT